MDIKDSYLHGTIGVVKSISVNEDKLTYTLADINQTTTTVTLPTATQTANGLLSSTDKIKLDTSTGINQSIPYIVGPTTDTTAGTWTGTYAGITDYTEGLTIIYVPNVAGASTTTLNINGIGSKVCYYTGASKVTTHYPAGTPILFTYSGGGWKRADYYYDSLQLRVYRQTTGYDADYPILVSRTLASSIGTSGSNNSYSNVYSLIGDDSTKTPTINPLTGEIKAPKFTGTFNGTASSVTNSLILKINSGSTEGTNLYTYNGAANKTLDIKQGDNVTLTATEDTLTIAASDSKVTQSDYTGSSNLQILLSYYTNNDTTASVRKSSKLTFNPSSGLLTTPIFKGDWTYTSDSRSVATIPSDYKSSFKFVGIKDPSVIGLTSTETGSWVSLFGWKGYSDNTGPHSWELASDSKERIWVRSGVGIRIDGSGNEDWNDWHKLAYISDIPTKISQLTNDSGYVTGGPYLPLSGGTMSGNLNMGGKSIINPCVVKKETDQSKQYLLVSQINLRSLSTVGKYVYIKTPLQNTSSDTNNGMNIIEFNIYQHKSNNIQNGVSKILLKWYGYDRSLTGYFRSSWTCIGDYEGKIYIGLDSEFYYNIIFEKDFTRNDRIDIPYFSTGFNRTADDSEGWNFGTTDDLNIFTAYRESTLEKTYSDGYKIPNGTSSQFLKADGSVENLSRIEIKTFTANTDGWYKIGTLSTTHYSFGLFTITKGYSMYPSESYLIAIGAGRNANNGNAYNSEFSINLLSGQYPVTQYIQKIRLSKINNSTTSIEVYITFNNGGSESFKITNINSHIVFQTPELVTETPSIYKEMSLVKGIKTSDKFYGDLVGNADTATKLATARTLWGQSFDGSSNVNGNITFDNEQAIIQKLPRVNANGGGWASDIIVTKKADDSYLYKIGVYGVNVTPYYMYLGFQGHNGLNNFRIYQDGVRFGTNIILHEGNYNLYSPKLDGTGATGTWGINITGSAAKLTTPRTLWGQSFDGTGNVTGDMTGVGSINRVFKVISTQDIAQLNVSEESSTVNYSHLYVSSNNTSNINTRPLVLQNGYGNVGIGLVAPTEKLEVNGNVKATSFIGNLDWSYIQNKPSNLPANGGDADTVDGKHASDFLQIYNNNIDDYTQCISLPRIKISYITGQGDFGSLTIPTFASNRSDYFFQTELRFDNRGGLKYRNLSHIITDEFKSLLDSLNYTNYVNTINFPGLNKTGTVTSVGLSVPTGFSVSSSSITTSGTLGITFASGYSLPTTAKQNNWDTVYNWYTSITATDTDALVNKWGEIVDFLDSVAEGTDITDEFVTRKTDQTITGAKTFATRILTISNPDYGDVTLKFYRGSNTAWSIVDTGGNLKFNELASNTTRLVLYESAQGGSAAFAGQVTATKFITSGGTSSKFVKGDGSLDSTTYATSASLGNYLPLSGGTMIDGALIKWNESTTSYDWTSDFGAGFKILHYNPTKFYGTGIHIGDSFYRMQLAYNASDSNIKFRVSSTSTTSFTEWKILLNETNYNSYSPKLDGTGATGTWNIDINGSANKLNNLSSSDFVRKYSAVGANNVIGSWIGYTYATAEHGGSVVGGVISVGTDSYYSQLNGSVSAYKLYYRFINNGNASNWKELAFIDNIPTLTSQLTNDSGFLISSDLTNYVTLDTAQTITGRKTFTQTIDIRKSTPTVKFLNAEGTVLGFFGYSAADKPRVWMSDGTTAHYLLHSGNYTSYTPILNSSSEHATNTSVIYAPTTAGTSGQYLMSNGSGAPVWASLSALANPYAIKFKNSAGTEVSYNGSQAIDLTGGVYESVYSNISTKSNYIGSYAHTNTCGIKYYYCGAKGDDVDVTGKYVGYNSTTTTYQSILRLQSHITDQNSLWYIDLIFDVNNGNIWERRVSAGNTPILKQIAWTSDIPATLKNPYSITFTNTTGTVITYDGSTSVDLSSGINYATKSSVANNGIFYIEGTGTTAGTWLGEHDEIKELYKGLTIAYKIPIAGASPTTLKINNLQAVTCYYNANSYLTTHYSVGSVILLVYDGTYFRVSDYDSIHIADCYTTTASSTAAKSASATYYKLRTGNLFICTVYRDNTAAAELTLNINSTGAKPIWINGTASSATNYTLPAGRYLVYYDGTNYYFYTNGGVKIPQVYGNAETSTNVKIQRLVADSDLNTLTTDGVYGTTVTSVCRSLINAPTDRINGEARLEISTCGNSNHVFQTLYAKLSNQYDIWIRSGSTSSFSAWSKILTSSNYNSYSPKLDGTGATGTWGISITGSAATLTTSRTIWGQSFDGSGNIDGNLTIIAGDTDKSIRFLSASGGTYNWRIAYIGTGTGNTNYLSFESTKATTNTWEPALQLACTTLNATFAGTVTAPNFVQNSNGISDFTNGIVQIKTLNALTNETETKYAKGAAGQILRSNGTNVYWSDLSKLTSTAIKTNQSYPLKNSSWTDTGYSISGLETGSYMIQVTSTNMVASGIFSVQKSLIDTMGDEIPLHVYGSADWRPYLRTYGTKLEISANHAATVSRTVTIKIVQII